MYNPLPGVLDTLRETVRETFETLTFSEVSDWEVVPQGPNSMEFCIGAGIAIKQPYGCRFTLLLDNKQCREFVETAYGPEITDDLAIDGIISDYIGELVNTIAGRLAAALAQPNEEIEIGLPQSCGMPTATEKLTTVTFLLEETVAWCFLEMEKA